MVRRIRTLLCILCTILLSAGLADSMVEHLSTCGSGVSLSRSSAMHLYSSLGRSFGSHAIHVVSVMGAADDTDGNGRSAASVLRTGEFMPAGLRPNQPNPFSTVTKISFAVKAEGRVMVRIYDVSGRLVRTALDEKKAPNECHMVIWDGRNDAGELVPSGLYFYQLVAQDFSETRKMVLLR